MEHLREYQDYVLANRLRALIGGRLRPLRHLSLAEYAQKRLERQRLARELLGVKAYHDRMRRVEALTDELNFGFWHNPDESVQVLRVVSLQGGCEALESPASFVAALLTPDERARLTPHERGLVAAYYLGLLRASAACLDAEVFTRLRAELEPMRSRLPVFVSEVGAGAASV